VIKVDGGVDGTAPGTAGQTRGNRNQNPHCRGLPPRTQTPTYC
jgi:hypothetical protein